MSPVKLCGRCGARCGGQTCRCKEDCIAHKDGIRELLQRRFIHATGLPERHRPSPLELWADTNRKGKR